MTRAKRVEPDDEEMRRLFEPVDEDLPPFELMMPTCEACGARLAFSDIAWPPFHRGFLVHNWGECLAAGNEWLAQQKEIMRKSGLI